MTTMDPDAREAWPATCSRSLRGDAVLDGRGRANPVRPVLAAATGSSTAVSPCHTRSRFKMIDNDGSSVESPAPLLQTDRRPRQPAPAGEAALITL